MLPRAPARKLAIVACMDARLDPYSVMGLTEGDAHVIRNAGGVVTDDAIRSLAISQRLLGTEEIVLIQHTDCGMQGLDEREFTGTLAEEAGFEPPWDVGGFDDLEANLRASIDRIKASPFIPRREHVRGLIYDVATRRTREVAH